MCKKQLFFIIAAFLLLFVSSASSIKADTNCSSLENDTCKNLSPQEKESCYSNVYSVCVKKIDSYVSQIKAFNSSIELTNFKISQTEQQIGNLTNEIASISGKIDNLESSLTTLSNVLIERIIASYKNSVHNNLGLLLFNSSKLYDLLVNLRYLQIVQRNDQKILFIVETTKINYTEQKQLREQKKQEQEQLQNKLAAQKVYLDQQKKDKEAFLAITRNNAEEYKKRYDEAIAELQALKSIQAGGGNVVSVGPVKTGDTIGYMISGNSACSSGTHLHFEVQKNGSVVDPSAYLKNTSYSYDYDTSLISDRISPNGSWDWPVND
ncbi:peptidoglycan DD-metalloendopeptidase family protein, partial [Candidatus Gottesmanbacteria bacterium]|nr:peptidoglycan DD-metalloendopeptidase family protein [Candidatus Gottesmanbacteria bacterium]